MQTTDEIVIPEKPHEIDDNESLLEKELRNSIIINEKIHEEKDKIPEKVEAITEDIVQPLSKVEEERVKLDLGDVLKPIQPSSEELKQMNDELESVTNELKNTPMPKGNKDIREKRKNLRNKKKQLQKKIDEINKKMSSVEVKVNDPLLGGITVEDDRDKMTILANVVGYKVSSLSVLSKVDYAREKLEILKKAEKFYAVPAKAITMQLCRFSHLTDGIDSISGYSVDINLQKELLEMQVKQCLIHSGMMGMDTSKYINNPYLALGLTLSAPLILRYVMNKQILKDPELYKKMKQQIDDNKKEKKTE